MTLIRNGNYRNYRNCLSGWVREVLEVSVIAREYSETPESFLYE